MSEEEFDNVLKTRAGNRPDSFYQKLLRKLKLAKKTDMSSGVAVIDITDDDNDSLQPVNNKRKCFQLEEINDNNSDCCSSSASSKKQCLFADDATNGTQTTVPLSHFPDGRNTSDYRKLSHYPVDNMHVNGGQTSVEPIVIDDESDNDEEQDNDSNSNQVKEQDNDSNQVKDVLNIDDSIRVIEEKSLNSCENNGVSSRDDNIATNSTENVVETLSPLQNENELISNNKNEILITQQKNEKIENESTVTDTYNTVVDERDNDKDEEKTIDEIYDFKNDTGSNKDCDKTSYSIKNKTSDNLDSGVDSDHANAADRQNEEDCTPTKKENELVNNKVDIKDNDLETTVETAECSEKATRIVEKDSPEGTGSIESTTTAINGEDKGTSEILEDEKASGSIEKTTTAVNGRDKSEIVENEKNASTVEIDDEDDDIDDEDDDDEIEIVSEDVRCVLSYGMERYSL